MALVVKDRVRETTTTTGTGTVTLAGAVAGFQSFSAIGNGNTTYYTINLPGANEWEVGIGTYTASGTTLSRDTILASSNSGSAVNFSAGTKDVFCTYPAGRSVYYDTSTNVSINDTLDLINLEVTNIKAKDGTAAIVLTDSTGAVAISTALTANGGAVFNENGANVDFRVEGDTDANLIFADASADTVGIGTSSPTYKLQVGSTSGTANVETAIFSGASYGVQTIYGLVGTSTFVVGNNNSGSDHNGLPTGTAGMWMGQAYPLVFGTNGGEKMRLGSAAGGVGALGIGYTSLTSVGDSGLAVLGNVGVGTSSPAVKFQTQQTSAGSRVTGALLQNVGDTANTAVSLDFAPHENTTTPTVLARINAIRTNSSNAPTDLVFSVFNATLQERARITSTGEFQWKPDGTTQAMTLNASGNLLVGDTSPPTANFRGFFNGSVASDIISVGVRNTDSSGISRLVLGNNAGASRCSFGYTGSTSSVYAWGASAGYIGTEGTEPFIFITSGSERARIDSSGNLGIRTNTPANKLSINQGSSPTAGLLISGTSSPQLVITETSTPVTAQYATDAAAAYLGTTTNHSLILRTNNTERARIDSSGNLGLGVTPSAWNTGYKAFVAGGTNSNNQVGGIASGSGITIVSTNYFRSSTPDEVYGGTGFAMKYVQSSGAHEWYTAPSGTAGATTSITSGQAYQVTTLGSTTLGQWQTYFSALTGIPSIGQTVTATATGTLAGGATVTQIAVFTQAMTLDASGNLSVGTTGIAATGQTNGITSGSVVAVTDELYDHTTNRGVLQYKSNITSLRSYGATSGSGIITFRTGGGGNTTDTERARITSGGDLLVGTQNTIVWNTTNEGVAISGVAIQASRSNDISLLLNRIGSDGNIQLFAREGLTVGTISVTTTATAYNTSSDYRLKDNPQPLTGSGAFIDALKPKTWSWKDDGSKGVGFIAHEVQEVSPGTVVGTKDAVDADGKPVMQAMEYGSAEFIANIVAELQSLRARVAKLEASK